MHRAMNSRRFIRSPHALLADLATDDIDLGMRVMDLELRTWYGAPGYFVLGAMHAVLFWISVSMLTPLVLLIGLFNGRRRLLHDLILGTIVINSSVRTQVAQPARTF